MGCVTEWDNADHTIMRRTLSAPWSFDDIHATEEEVYRAIEAETGPTGLIIHLADPFYLPPNALKKYQRQLTRKPHQVVITVFVVKSTPMVNMLYGIVERIGRRNSHIVKRTECLDEARAIITEHLDLYSDRTRPGALFR